MISNKFIVIYISPSIPFPSLHIQKTKLTYDSSSRRKIILSWISTLNRNKFRLVRLAITFVQFLFLYIHIYLLMKRFGSLKSSQRTRRSKVSAREQLRAPVRRSISPWVEIAQGEQEQAGRRERERVTAWMRLRSLSLSLLGCSILSFAVVLCTRGSTFCRGWTTCNKT